MCLNIVFWTITSYAEQMRKCKHLNFVKVFKERIFELLGNWFDMICTYEFIYIYVCVFVFVTSAYPLFKYYMPLPLIILK